MSAQQNSNPDIKSSRWSQATDLKDKTLPWHHIHITLPDREAAAIWLANHTPVERRPPTKRSENLVWGPNLLQIQTDAVANEPRSALIDSVGMGVTNLESALAKWQSGGGSVVSKTTETARMNDPWGTPFEMIETDQAGFTHINIATPDAERLRAWYLVNLGGEPVPCGWNSSRLVLMYDTIQIVFAKMEPDFTSTAGRPLDHLGWYTDDLDATFERLSANGVSFPVPPREFGPVRLAFAEDPCGIWFELLESQDGNIIK